MLDSEALNVALKSAEAWRRNYDRVSDCMRRAKDLTLLETEEDVVQMAYMMGFLDGTWGR